MAKENDEKNLPVLSKEELKAYDGQNGHKVYVVYKDKVYDVSKSPWWEEGMHQGEHVSGHDLTDEIDAAPHSTDVLKKFKIVALFKKD